MAALVGRIPRPQMRLALLENLGDEHGSGRLTVCHENTFLELLARLGVDRLEVERRALWPEVRAFNAALLGTCSSDDVYTGLAALGIIEDLFAGISAELGQSIVARGWLKRREVVHYATHEALDVEHAEGFYASLHEPYDQHPRWRYQIDQGLELGAYVFLRLYDDLWRARDRRWNREVLGPHTLVGRRLARRRGSGAAEHVDRREPRGAPGGQPRRERPQHGARQHRADGERRVHPEVGEERQRPLLEPPGEAEPQEERRAGDAERRRPPPRAPPPRTRWPSPGGAARTRWPAGPRTRASSRAPPSRWCSPAPA